MAVQLRGLGAGPGAAVSLALANTGALLSYVACDSAGECHSVVQLE